MLPFFFAMLPDTAGISETSLTGGVCLSMAVSLNPNLNRKEVISYGSSDLDGAFRAG